MSVKKPISQDTAVHFQYLMWIVCCKVCASRDSRLWNRCVENLSFHKTDLIHCI